MRKFLRELDYYYTNSISRSSKTMSECRQIRQKIKKMGQTINDEYVQILGN